MKIIVRVYPSIWPSLSQAVPALLAAAMWSFSTAAVLSGRHAEINPVWSWLPLPWMVVVQAAVVFALAAVPYLADEPAVSVLLGAPWAAVLAHDVLQVLGAWPWN